jgi:hypothetical protein
MLDPRSYVALRRVADWVGARTVTLSLLVALLRTHVMAAERLHGDDTTVPVLATGWITTGRLWVCVRNGFHTLD